MEKYKVPRKSELANGIPDVNGGCTSMFDRQKTLSFVLGSSFLVGGMALVAPPAQAAVCGFEGVTTDSIGSGDDGKYEAGKYNHCGTGNVTLQIDYVYANERYCVTPGVTEFAANPNLGAVTNIYAVGEC